MPEQKIDYLSFTMEKEITRIGTPVAYEKSFVSFYKYMTRFDSGITVHTGNPNSERVLHIASGDACKWIEENEGMIPFIADIIETGARVSRADLCVTVASDEENFFTIGDVVKAINRGAVTGSHYERGGAKSIRNERTGLFETVYVGDMSKRGKHGIFRAYDKGIELGLDSEILTRLELEEKRDKAQTAMKRLVRGETIGNLIQQRVQFDDAIINAVLGAMTDITYRFASDDEEENERNRWKWLIEQVAPVLGEEMAIQDARPKQGANMQDMNYETFLSAVGRAYRRKLTELNR